MIWDDIILLQKMARQLMSRNFCAAAQDQDGGFLLDARPFVVPALRRDPSPLAFVITERLDHTAEMRVLAVWVPALAGTTVVRSL
jgi:hypothetical protein